MGYITKWLNEDGQQNYNPLLCNGRLLFLTKGLIYSCIKFKLTVEILCLFVYHIASKVNRIYRKLGIMGNIKSQLSLTIGKNI
jgi:hypothetical protein